MNSNFLPLHNDDDLQSENNFLKMKMMLEQGAQFGTIGNRPLPPAIENEFLKSIIEFEKQAANKTYVSVFDKIHRPSHFKSPGELEEVAMPAAWFELSDYLLSHGISLEVCNPNITEKELYRFTIEELFEEEVENISIPGMTQCFIYDLFHPDAIFENTRIAKEECMEYILSKTPMQWTCNFKNENLHLNNNIGLSMAEFIRIINRFKEAHDFLDMVEIKETVCVINENESWVTGNYTMQATVKKEVFPLSGNWKVDFEKEEYLDYWYIKNVCIEGIRF